ncbi:hypothetical protein [uncultured Polaribacter sp.]|uniref:hypothetical protein n=1 Tax=uncultured Polaribacter sp. TaxID=174711 RepID=UPI00260F1B98|nr:hypothetical protein [uncultured Polaribacter sp.]
MQIQNKENYIFISSEENTFEEFYNALLKEKTTWINTHTIVQISDNINITTKDFLLFLDVVEEKRALKTSFIIIYSAVDVDEVSEEISIVPTLQEAEDLYEMENIERELGF